MDKPARARTFLLLAAGLLLGQLLGPAIAWAQGRMEVNWPSYFRLEANRTWPVNVERPVEVRLDRTATMPEFAVNVEEMPELRIDGLDRLRFRSDAPTFSPLRETDTATWFVAGEADGACRVMKLEHATGRVVPVSEFRL